MGRAGLREYRTGFPNLGQRFTENMMEVFLTVEKHTRRKAGHHDHGLEYNLVASRIHTIVPPARHHLQNLPIIPAETVPTNADAPRSW